MLTTATNNGYDEITDADNDNYCKIVELSVTITRHNDIDGN